MATKKYYSKKEVQELVSREVAKATKSKGYSYSKWAIQDFLVGVVGITLIIVIVVIIAALGF